MRFLRDLMAALLFSGAIAMSLLMITIITGVVFATTVPFVMYDRLYLSILITMIGYLGTLIMSRMRLTQSPITW